MSYRSLYTKPLNASLAALLKRTGHIGLGLSAFAPVLALANPTGGTVIAGTATITNPNANGTVVKETSAAAIIDWQQFNIGKGQYVQFLQPSSSSIILNRVIGGGGSSIYGSLTGNGQIFLVNTNGVFFGKGSSIDAQGFLASTLDISDSDFLARNFVFDKSGSDATVINQGSITAHKGGYVVLAGDYTENDGVIAAQSGHIILASGTKSTLTLNGNSLVSFAVNQATLAQLAGVTNAGKLEANGGTVIMTADVANLLKATVVNNTGLIEATSLSNQGGVIQLLATGGNISNAGTLDVAATRAGQQGGSITLKGDEKTLLTDASKIIATGDDANGGKVEVSGETLSMRGTMTLGKGGRLLLDPTRVTISDGSDNVDYNASSATSGAGLIGIKFIDKTLNSGANVTIAAYGTISHSAHATQITATGTGNLILNVRHGGSIKLAGVDIAIGGDFDASVSPAGTGSHNAFMAFGRISARNIRIDAGDGDVELADAVTVSGKQQASLKATGSINLAAANVAASGYGSLILAANKDILIHGSVGFASAGNIGMTTGSGEGIMAGKITSAKNISLTAGKGGILVGSHSLDVVAGENISIKGGFGTGRNQSVTLDAGGTITLDHGIGLSRAAAETLTITGQQLAYTGTGTFTLSAGYGTLILDASIGTAKAPVKYDVDLKAGFKVDVERSVFTTGSIAVIASNGGLVASSGGSGIHIGNLGGPSHAVDLSAKGAVNIQAYEAAVGTPDARVIVGGDGTVSISADDGNAKTTTDDLGISAKYVDIQGFDASADNNAASLSVDNSVTLHAGHDVTIDASSLSIGYAGAFAEAHYGGGVMSAKIDVTITAGNDIDLTGHYVNVRAGRASASIDNDSKSVVSATAETNVTLDAGHDVVITATDGDVDISGGYGWVADVTSKVKQNATATANANVTITAGHDITLTATGHDVDIEGRSAGYGARISASQSGAKATATAHADVALSAGTAISLTGNSVEVFAGEVARPRATSFESSCSGTCFKEGLRWVPVQVGAKGQNAAANMTATANMSLTAGTGGITLTATDRAELSAGYGAAIAASVDAGSLGGKAALVAESKLVVTTTGTLSVLGESVNVEAGGRPGAGIVNFFEGSNSHGTFEGTSAARPKVMAAEGGTATLTADTSVTVKANSITMGASTGALKISAGYGAAGDSIEVIARGPQTTATANVTSAVNIMSAKGIKLDAKGALEVFGAGPHNSSTGVAEDALISASFGAKASLAAAGNVAMTAGASFLASADEVEILAGRYAAEGDKIIANHGSVNVSANAGVSVTAKTTLTINAAGFADITAGRSAAADNTVKAIRGTVTENAFGNVSLVAGGNIAATIGTAGSHLDIEAGSDAGDGDIITAQGAGTKVSLSGNGGVSVTGANIVLKATKNLDLRGSDSAARSVDINANSGAVVTDTGLANLVITAHGKFSASAGSSLSVEGGERVAADGETRATGAGAKATTTGDGSVSITATGAVTLKGTRVGISGSGEVGSDNSVTANSGGAAALSAKGGVSIAAGGNFLASAVNGALDISGGDFAGGDEHVDAFHGTATVAADASVRITANGTTTLKAKSNLNISGGTGAASDVHMEASDGKAGETATNGVSITATGAFTASAGVGLDILGGRSAGRDVSASVDAGGAATVTGDNGVHISVGATTLKADTGLAVRGGAKAGSEADLEVDGGKASETAFGGVSITAKGAVTASDSGAALDISGGSRVALGVFTSAHGGGAAALTADAGVHLTLGATTLKAKTNLAVHGGAQVGSAVDLEAGDGKTNVTGFGGVSLTDTGAFTATASGALAISGGALVGKDGSVSAGAKGNAALNASAATTIAAGGAVSLKAGTTLKVTAGYSVMDGSTVHKHALADADGSGAVANLSADGSLTIKGSSVNLTAGGALSINSVGTANSGGKKLAHYASASAENHGVATMTANDALTVVTGGAFKAVAGGNLTVHTGNSAAMLTSIDARGAGAKATLTAVDTVNVTAQSITFSASGSLAVHGGKHAGSQGHVNASNHGSATETVTDGVNLTASKSVLAALVGSHSSHDLQFSAGSSGARKIQMQADGSAVVTANVDDSVNVKVTGAGGTVALRVGAHQTSAWLGINGGYNLADSATVFGDGGKATLNATGEVNITAPGTITLTDSNGDLSIFPGDAGGVGAQIHAEGKGATATLNGNLSVNIKGGTIDITAASSFEVYGDFRNLASGAKAVGSDGGKAVATFNGTANLNAAGNINFTAGTEGSIYGGQQTTLHHASVAAYGGSAALTAHADANITAGGNITIKVGDTLDIFGNNGAPGESDDVFASDAGKAALAFTGNVNIKAGKAFTASDSHSKSIDINAGVVANSAEVVAVSKGTANASFQTNVNITAGTTVTVHAAGALGVTAGDAGRGNDVFASDGAKAGFTADSLVNIKAGGNLSLAAGAGGMSLEGAAGDFSGTEVTGDDGTATAAANSSVALTAGGTLTLSLTAGHNLLIAGGGGDGLSMDVNATGATGKATVTGTTTVSLTAASAMKETGADALNIIAGGFPASTAEAIINDLTGGKGTATFDSGITIKGKSLSFAHSGLLTETPRTAVDVGGLMEKGAITITGGHITGFTPDGLSLMDAAAPSELTPSTGESSFGASGKLGSGVDLSAIPYGSAVDLTPSAGIQLLPSAGSAPLSTLLGDGVVLDLLPLLSAAQPLQLLGTDFTPGQGSSSHALGSQCLVTLVQDHGSSCRTR